MKQSSTLTAALLVAGFGILGGAAFAQAPAIQWQKSYGTANSENIHAIKSTADGGYVFAGTKYMGMSESTADFWVVKTDAVGNTVWDKNFGGTSFDEARDIIQTTDGGYMVVGETRSGDGAVTGNKGGYDYWVVKLDVGGNISWEKCFGGSANDLAHSVKQTFDGGYVIAGKSQSNDGDVTTQYLSPNAYWIVKINSTGDITWEKMIESSLMNTAYSIIQTPDSGYVVAGAARGLPSGKGADDFGIIKLDKNGNTVWQKSYGGSSNDIALAIIQTADGGFAVAGYSTSNNGDVASNKGSTDYWIVKLDGQGDMEWQQSYGGSGLDLAHDIAQTDDGGYLVLGFTGSANGDVTDSKGLWDMWLLKLDDTGGLVWQKTYGGSGYERGFGIAVAADGSYVIAGNTSSSDQDVTTALGGNDGWVVKLSSAGEPLPITLKDIAARNSGNVNIIDWVTAMETIGEEFELQRSTDGRQFQAIANIKSRGIAGSYQHTDTQPLPGINYYRLFVNSHEGYNQYSKIVSAALAGKDVFSFHLSPNPAKGVLHVFTNGTVPRNAVIEILTLEGKVIKTISIPGNETNIDVSDIPGGIYIARYNNGTHIVMNKLVVE